MVAKHPNAQVVNQTATPNQGKAGLSKVSMTQSKRKLLSNQTINCDHSQDQNVFNATMINPIIQQFEELDLLSKEIIKQ